MKKWLSSEEQILKRIVLDKQVLANTIHFSLDSAFPHPDHAFSQDIFVAVNVDRVELGLNPGEKPGDIDYLVIPFKGERIFFEKTIAIEAKIVRPTLSKPQRNTNKMGKTQTLGLVRDGFPFVGLLHISVPEPLPSDMHRKIPILSNNTGANPLCQNSFRLI